MNKYENQQISTIKVWTTLKDHHLIGIIEDEELTKPKKRKPVTATTQERLEQK